MILNLKSQSWDLLKKFRKHFTSSFLAGLSHLLFSTLMAGHKKPFERDSKFRNFSFLEIQFVHPFVKVELRKYVLIRILLWSGFSFLYDMKIKTPELTNVWPGTFKC